MRIGFDVSQTGQGKSGCGYVAHSLIQTLQAAGQEHEYVLYRTFGDFYWDPDWARNTYCAGSNTSTGLSHTRLEQARAFWTQPPNDLETRLGKPDLIQANNFFCPTGLTQSRLVYLLHDLNFLVHPELSTEANRVGCFNGVFNAAQVADAVVAVSGYSRDHFLQIFPHYPAERVHVVHPASRFQPDKTPTACNAFPQLKSGSFWLSVGTLEPRKNLQLLLNALARLKAKQGSTRPLVIAGGRGWLMDDLIHNLHVLDLQDDVILAGYVDDAVLAWLYANCRALCYPTRFEGFGLPVLEAMSLGAPVIASRVTAIPEVVQDAGLLIDPDDELDLAQAMQQLDADETLRQALSRCGLARAQAFSWQKTAQAFFKIYEHTLERPKLT